MAVVAEELSSDHLKILEEQPVVLPDSMERPGINYLCDLSCLSR